MNKIDVLKEQIEKAKKIVISTHVSPDGDAIGSSLGLYHYLINIGKSVTVIVPNEFPTFLKWMPKTDEIFVYEGNEEEGKKITEAADLIFSLDYNEPHRTAMYSKTLEASNAYKVVIDHHIGEPTWQNLNLSVVGASSTCELIFDTIVALSSEEYINQDIAYCLYSGLLTDTGSFQFSATTPKVHIIAASLLSKGVQPDLVHNHILNSFSESRLKFFGFCINKKMKIVAEKKLAYIFLTKKELNSYSLGVGGTEGLVNEPMKISDIDISILFKQDKDKIKISFRSKKDIDISKFASAYFEGGGHKNASGGVSYLTIEETEKKLLLLINKI
ncbi:MAG: DHH family phosphoesterase [Chitinophagales bacterium]